MQQYLDLLRKIKKDGVHKPAAREGMPGTTSLFGYQFRHNLQEGFPLLTTKKVSFKNIVNELIWFLRGDTNIKFLVDNGCNIWNEDAYNYYLKTVQAYHFNFEDFISMIKSGEEFCPDENGYTFGDCGFQYGKVWRRWRSPQMGENGEYIKGKTDQISQLIHGLKNNPESRRHIVTAIDPAHDNDLALYWCHAMFQFNCRPIEYFIGDGVAFGEEGHYYRWIVPYKHCDESGCNNFSFIEITKDEYDDPHKPKYYLDCQLYQRSADVFLGVPYNIGSYALLTHILCKLCNMEVGDLIMSYGDVHIYDDHMDAVNQQLKRMPDKLPRLAWQTEEAFDLGNGARPDFEDFINAFEYDDLIMVDYNPQPLIKAKLSTGLK